MSVDQPSVDNPPQYLRTVSSNSSLSSGTGLSRRPRTRGRSRTPTGNSSPISPSQFTGNETPYLDKEIVQEPVPSTSSNGLIMAESRSDEPNSAPEVIRLSKAAIQASHLSSIRTGYKPPPSAFSRVPLSQIDPDPSRANVRDSIRDSVITQDSEITQQTHVSSVYPLSTVSASVVSPSSPTESVIGDMPEQLPIVDEIKSFDGDDVSYRLRLLVNNNYFLPPAHSKPLPNQLAPVTPTLPKKPPTPTGFLDLFRLGKSKAKSPSDGNTPTFDGVTPALRTTSDSTQVSGFPMQIQPSASSSTANAPRASNLARLADRPSRVVVVREKMTDLAGAAKQAELEMKARPRDARREETAIDDVIDPTDSVDLPLPSSKYPFAVQTSALHGLGVTESVGAAALADHLPPRSHAISSPDPDDDWKKALLEAAVGHSFESLNAAAEGKYPSPPRSPLSPAPSSILSASTKLDKKIISSPIVLESSLSRPLVNSSLTSTPKPAVASSSSPSSPSPIPIRTETPSMPLEPLLPPPRRQFINPLYSLSQTDLTDAAEPVPSSSSSDKMLSSAGRMTPSPNLSNVYRQQGWTMTPPPLPRHSKLTRDSLESSVKHRESSDRDSRPSRLGFTSVQARSATPDTISMYSVAMEDRPSNDAGSVRASMSSDSTVASPSTSAFQDALSRNPSEMRLDEDDDEAQMSVDLRQQQSDFGHSTAFVRTSSESRKPELTISPPPTQVSSLTPEHVSPPPRSTSLHYRDLRDRVLSTASSPPSHPCPSLTLIHRPASDHGHASSTSSTPIAKRRPPTAPAASSSGMSSPRSESNPRTTPGIKILEFSAPGPTTPPFPSLHERRQSRNPLPNLTIPTSAIPPEIRSAPLAPSSPMSFFDTIQSQPNAMDFLDESDDESDSEDETNSESDGDGTIEGRLSITHSTYSSRSALSTHSTPSALFGSRTSFMRLGNHSTPYVARSALNEFHDVPRTPPPPLPISSRLTDRRPIGNVPQKTPFFTKKIRDDQVLESSFDLYQYTRSNSSSKHPYALTGAPPTREASSSAAPSRTRAASSEVTRSFVHSRGPSTSSRATYSKGKESEKLDGLLKMHMESEKERMKGVAERLKKARK